MPSKGGGRKEQRENPNAIKKAYQIDKEQPKGMTLTPQSHALVEDTKIPTKQPTIVERTTKMRKNTVLGAHAGCTTHKSRVIHELIVHQVVWKITCVLYH